MMNATEEFLSLYVSADESEMEAKFLQDAESVQRLNAHLEDIALGEALAVEHFAGLRFVG